MRTQSAIQILILLLFAGAVFGANIPLQVVSVTSQQAEIQYTSPISGPCSLALTDNSGMGVTVWDVNGSVFANANLDLSRPDTLLDGMIRKVLLGHRTAEQGTNGNFYSRSLQADAPHTLTVTCGPNSGTVQFATNTIQQGEAYPEMPQYCANGLWGRCLPTIDYSVAGKEIGYVDPLTGALVKRVTGPGEAFARLSTSQSLSYAKDVSGVAAWTNATNAVNYNTSGPYASSSTTGSATSPAGAALFIGWNALNNQGNIFGGYNYANTSIDDFQLRVHALTSTGTANIAACFTVDGVTCFSPVQGPCPATTTAADMFFGPGACTGATFPNTPWLGPFSGWGSAMTKYPPASFTRNSQPLAVTATSSAGVTTLTINSFSGGGGQLFELDTPANAPMYVPGSSAVCQNNVCTVKAVNSSVSMTLNENPGSLGSITVQPTAGFLIWKSAERGPSLSTPTWTTPILKP